jgi:hypothetical protein
MKGRNMSLQRNEEFVTFSQIYYSPWWLLFCVYNIYVFVYTYVNTHSAFYLFFLFNFLEKSLFSLRLKLLVQHIYYQQLLFNFDSATFH